MNDDARVGESVAHLAELHRTHEQSTTAIQRAANRVTGHLGRPATLAVVLLLILGWMCGNYIAQRLGVQALEEFPFPDLAFVATLAAVVIALAILTTQQHQDQLAQRRAELTLQIAVLSEKKMTKLIDLIEEQRRDNPMLSSRVDKEAEAMARSIAPEESVAQLDGIS